MKYEDMLNTITLGDSYELIKNIPDNSIDLIVTAHLMNIQRVEEQDVLELRIEVIIKNIIKLLKIQTKNIKMKDKKEYGKTRKNREKK